jgi:hypothetical protein
VKAGDLITHLCNFIQVDRSHIRSPWVGRKACFFSMGKKHAFSQWEKSMLFPTGGAVLAAATAVRS